MKTIQSILILGCLAIVLTSFKMYNTADKYKCMIQMTNYTGEGAYIVISLINPEGEYVKTLQVQGDDDEWYNTIESWWQYQGKVRADLDAITGATISGGERAVCVIEIESDTFDKGYKLRFESAVEDQEYYEGDVEIELNSETIKGKINGTGFIRYVRMMPQ